MAVLVIINFPSLASASLFKLNGALTPKILTFLIKVIDQLGIKMSGTFTKRFLIVKMMNKTLFKFHGSHLLTLKQ